MRFLQGNYKLVYWAKTDLGGEKQTQLDKSEGKQVMFSLPLPPLQKNDIIECQVHLRATNNDVGNIAFGGQILLADSSDQIEPIIDEDAVTYWAGFNISLNMHHGLLVHTGCTNITDNNLSRNYINFVSRAQTDIPGDPHLRIDRYYGQLTYKIFSTFYSNEA